MLKNTTLKKQQQTPRVALAFHDKYKKYYPTLAMLIIAVIFLCVSGDVFAKTATENKAALTGMVDDFVEIVSGKFVKLAIYVMGLVVVVSAAFKHTLMPIVIGVGIMLFNYGLQKYIEGAF